jgi:hypothetical protein
MSKEKDRSEFFLDDAFFLDDGKDLIKTMKIQEDTILEKKNQKLKLDTEIELLKEEHIEKDDYELEKLLSLSITETQIEELRNFFKSKFGYGLSTGIRTVIIEYMKENDIF